MTGKQTIPITGVHPMLARACTLLYQMGVIVLKTTHGYYPGDPEDINVSLRTKAYEIKATGPITKVGEEIDPLIFYLQADVFIIQELMKILPEYWRVGDIPDIDDTPVHSFDNRGPVYQLEYTPPEYITFLEAWDEVNEEVLYDFLETHDTEPDQNPMYEYLEYVSGESNQAIDDINVILQEGLPLDKSQIDELRKKGADLLSESLSNHIATFTDNMYKHAADLLLQNTEQAVRLSHANLQFHDIFHSIEHLHETFDSRDPSIYSEDQLNYEE